MKWQRWAWLFLLPVSAWAQHTFGPIRLDDSIRTQFYYPEIGAVDSGFVRAIWGGVDSQFVFAFSRRLSMDGVPQDSHRVFTQEAISEITCSPNTKTIPLSNGGEARLYEYS